MTDFIANTIPSPPDQRDIPYVPKSRPPYPAFVDLMPDVHEVENQGSYGTCVANGACSQAEWLANSMRSPVDLSRAFVYFTGREISKMPANQEGMIPRDALKAMFRHGVPLETEWPYSGDNISTQAPEPVYRSAFGRRVTRFEVVHHNHIHGYDLGQQTKADKIKAALAEGLPVGFAMVVTRSLVSLKGPWRAHQYDLAGTTNTIGGHYMVIIGYDDSCGLWLVQNSWGPAWGDGGFCGLPYAIVDEPFFEAWVIRDFAGYAVPETPGVKLELRNQYAINARIVPPAAMIGQTVSLWVGAKLPDGCIYMKTTTDADTWQLLIWPDFPACGLMTLDADNDFRVVQWMDLSQFEGAEIYVAFGNSPLDWHKEKLCTL